MEVARRDHLEKDGFVVLADSNAPERMHMEGAYKLSDELRAAGTVPQFGGEHRCALKFKAFVIETWLRERFVGSLPRFGLERVRPARVGQHCAIYRLVRRLPHVLGKGCEATVLRKIIGLQIRSVAIDLGNTTFHCWRLQQRQRAHEREALEIPCSVQSARDPTANLQVAWLGFISRRQEYPSLEPRHREPIPS